MDDAANVCVIAYCPSCVTTQPLGAPLQQDCACGIKWKGREKNTLNHALSVKEMEYKIHQECRRKTLNYVTKRKT